MKIELLEETFNDFENIKANSPSGKLPPLLALCYLLKKSHRICTGTSKVI